MRDLRAETVVSCGVRMSRWRSGSEVLKRIVRWSGGGWNDGERRGEEGREEEIRGTERVRGRRLVGEEDDEEDDILVRW
jgi:hypothetical protein